MYGKEDTSYLNPDILTEYCKTPMIAIQNIIRDIFFNKNHPENRTLRITNKQLPHAQVYDGGLWRYTDKKDTVDQLIDRGYQILGTHFEEVAIKKLKDYQIARYRNFRELFQSDDPALRRRLTREIEISILNGGNM